MDVAARGLGKATSRSGERVLGVAALVAVVVSATLSLVVAPPDAVQGEVQRLMYVHVPAAWLAYLSFFVVFVSSVAYLQDAPDPVGPDRRRLGRDRRAVHRARDRPRRACGASRSGARGGRGTRG